MTVPALAVAEHVPLPDPPAPGTPGPFSFGDADHVRAVLAAAGFADVTIEPFETSLLLGGVGTVDAAVAFLRDTGMGRTLLSEASADVVDAALAGVRDALAPAPRRRRRPPGRRHLDRDRVQILRRPDVRRPRDQRSDTPARSTDQRASDHTLRSPAQNAFDDAESRSPCWRTWRCWSRNASSRRRWDRCGAWR